MVQLKAKSVVKFGPVVGRYNTFKQFGANSNLFSFSFLNTQQEWGSNEVKF